MNTTVAIRVRKHRDALRAAGMKPIQIWVPDIKAKGFAEEIRRQAIVVAKADLEDFEQTALLDNLLEDLIEKDC
jgi:hypothetical protein